MTSIFTESPVQSASQVISQSSELSLICCYDQFINLFIGVIFALKVLTTHYWPNPGGVNVGGFLNVSSKYAVWAELVYIQLLTPNASFVGHLAGILVGIAYVKGPLSFLIDAVESIVFGDISRARPSRTTSGGYDQSRYRAGTTDYSHFFRNFFRNRAAGPGWRF